MRRRAVIFEDDALIRFTLWKLFDARELRFSHSPNPAWVPLM
jgi:hypothetical protein